MRKQLRGAFLVTLSAVLALAALFPASVSSQAKSQHLKVAGSTTDLQSLDPQFGGTTSGEAPLIDMIYEGLVRLRPGSTDIKEIQPALAERWVPSADHTVWTFFLRKGVPFHKGFGEFTSLDAKFSLERNMTATSPWRSSYANVAQIETPNPYALRVTLKQPDPFFFLSVANYRGGFIVSKAAVERLGEQYKLNPVGTGPFQFESYRPRDRVELRRNEQYWRGKPALDAVTWLFMSDPSARELAFRSKTSDMGDAELSSDWIAGLTQGGLRAIGLGPGVSFLIHLNTSHPPLNDLRVRRALHYGTNPEEFRQLLGKNITSPLFSPVPPGYYGATDSLPKYPYDLAKAKALLGEAGKANGVSLKAVVSQSSGMPRVMTLLQEQWRKININLELEIVDHTSYHRLIRQDKSDVVIYSFTRAPLADVVLSEFFHSKSVVGRPTAVTNFSHYDKADQFIDQARTMRDAKEQLKLYASAQKQIMEDAVVIPLTSVLWVIMAQPNVELPELGGIEQPKALNYFVPVTEKSRLR